MNTKKIKKSVLKETRGNAILISFALSTFLIMASAGSAYIAVQSSREMATIENGRKSFFSAEAALEGALFDSAVHTYGWTEGMPPVPTVDFGDLNSSTGNYEVNGRKSMTAIRSLSDNSHLVLVPGQKTNNIGDKENWTSVGFREKAIFPLFADEITRGRKKISLGTPLSTGEKAEKIDNINQQILEEEGKTPPNIDILKKLEQQKQDLMSSGNTFSNTSVGTTPNDSSGETSNLDTGLITKSPTASVNKANIESAYIDLLVPTFEFQNIDISEEESRPLFSWTVQGIAEYSDNNGNLQNDPIQMISTQNCGSETLPVAPAGTICTNHFSGTMFPVTNPDMPEDFVSPKILSNLYSIYQVLDGTSDTETAALRLANPQGYFQNPVTKRWEEATLVQFLRGEMPSGGSFTLLEPKVTVQMLKEKKKKTEVSSQGKLFPNAYARIGIRLNSSLDANTIRQNFPVPSEDITIKAIGEANGYKQVMEVTVKPQSIAPMFEYAIFQ